MSLPKSILFACLVVAGCATQQESTDRPAEASLGPGGLTITTVAPADEVAPSESAATSPEDDKWQRIEDFLARQDDGADSGEIDAKEMLGLWDEQGHFRRDYWEALTHERRIHCVAVLSLCGNGGAIRAQGQSLSEQALLAEGPYIANGTFGTQGRGYLDRPGRSDPDRPGRVRIRLPEASPNWRAPSQATIDDALGRGLPLVICFPIELEWRVTNWEVKEWANDELAEMSKSEAVFIQVSFTQDGERSPAKETVVPASKILSDNPTRAYGVSRGDETVIIADAHGNECFRMTRVPKADDLKRLLDQVADHAARTNAKLQANLDKANAQLEKGERRAALSYLLKNFDEGVVGLEAQLDSIDAYTKIIEEGLAELAKLVQAGDKEGLKALAREFAGTDLEKEIDEAIEELK